MFFHLVQKRKARHNSSRAKKIECIGPDFRCRQCSSVTKKREKENQDILSFTLQNNLTNWAFPFPDSDKRESFFFLQMNFLPTVC